MSNFTDYIAFEFTNITEELAEILMAELGAMPFESFDYENEVLKAYVSTLKWEENAAEEVKEIAAAYDVQFTQEIIKGENWNAAWESSFQPVEIPGKVRICADFHERKQDFPYEITINPKMAFGTGHHYTTKLVMESMFDIDFTGKTVLDMGCGTGILAILAEKLGATSVVAIDNDPQCIESVLENIELNHTSTIKAQLLENDLPSFPQVFDVIIANIQRNVLLAQMAWYAECLKPNGDLFLSGIYTQDMDAITNKAFDCGFNLKFRYKEENNWLAIHLSKS